MLLRRTALIAATAAALACEPSVPHSTNPSSIDVAAFDLTPGHPDIPLPNDLALLPDSVNAQTGAQKELLQAFQAAGGFPNDQEVPITIDFVHEAIDPSTGAQTPSAPALDVSSINSSNLVILSLSLNSFGAKVAYDPPKASDYVVSGDHGTLTLHKSLAQFGADPAARSRRFAPATYVVAVRGGQNGVKVTGSGDGLSPMPTMFLLLQGQNLNLPQNQTLIPGATPAEKQATAAKLEQLRAQYDIPFKVIDGVFPHKELAVMSTFAIAPIKSAHVETDPSGGFIPLPSDFLLDPANGGKTVVNNPAFGPFASGLATLDGFSTTAMILSQVSAPIQAATVTGGVFLFELDLQSSPPKATRLADLVESLTSGGKVPARFLAEPPAITKTPPGTNTAVSTAIGLQPAVPVQVPAGGPLVTLPPLREGTEYAVIVTSGTNKGVQDLNGKPLGRSTLGKLLLFQNALSVNGKSAVGGVDDATAGALEQMRQVLQLPIGTLLATNSTLTRDDIVMAYTFRTQTFSGVAVKLAAAPYDPTLPPALVEPVSGTTVPYCDVSAACGSNSFATLAGRYGVNQANVGLNGTHLTAVLESRILTLNTLDPATGAGQPDPTKWTPEPIPILVSIPNSTPGGACVPTPGKAPCPIPLVVFRHGLNGARAAALTVMDQFAAAGFAVAAIDANKHGERSLCKADSDCVSGATCVHDPALANQGDAPNPTPGRCTGPASAAVNGSLLASSTGGSYASPVASGNFLVTGNLFRTRDSLRQDILDQSQVLHVLARDPAQAAIDPKADLFKAIAGLGNVVIDPRSTFFVGQSLGSISGTVDVAANPRFSQAVFNVGGGTVVDIFTSPAFANAPGGLGDVLKSLGIAPGSPQYLQLINVAKWVVDPAEPVNYAQHLTANTLPNLLPPLGGKLDGSVAQQPKRVLGQLAACDATIANPFNFELYNLIGLGPVPPAGTTVTTGTLQVFTGTTSTPLGCPNAAVPHSFFTTYPNPATRQAQVDAANFLLGGSVPSVRNP